MSIPARALLADVALVLLFVIIGRSNHDEASAVTGVTVTATPFLVGLGLGWVVIRAWRRPLRLAPEGVTVWLSTVAVGILLRAVSGQGTAWSFVVVASLVLAAFLLGWRALAPLARRNRTTSPASGGSLRR